MVMSSAQISALNSSFQGGMMNQMAYASMLGQLPSQQFANQAAGSTVNTMGALASPIGMGALAFKGLDPFSMAFRGGMAGLESGGLAGMATGALGGAALVGAPLMAASYAGGQFMQGAQQHQMLRTQLNSSFGFRNQFGGTGFTNPEVGMIGSTLRNMTTQLGPAGEMVNFDELGRLASNMARMGMAQGVRNAKEFTDKFKQMVSALKEIATEMGTSLEEAQKMMGSMRQAGVFNTAQQTRMAGRIRTGAAAGGLATSELTGMMQVGSQLSRMIGGRGGAGAEAGLSTLTNIGVAQQMGVLSEEDIYNATGLTGAEGRRALATQQLQQSASFLQSGLGRHMVAAMAGRNGQLDQGSLQEFMSGHVGVERTRELWQKGLANVGRANFIRNEGRLRGEILRQFGGLAPAVAMRGWLESKGIDVNQDNDRAMLFLQRRLGMGRDEADIEIKELRNLPQMLHEQQIAGKQEDMAQRFRQREMTTGIMGVKNKLNKAMAEVRASLQGAGDNFMQGVENLTEESINFLTGTRVKEFNRDVIRSFEESRSGGVLGQRAASTTFGIGGGVAQNLRGLRTPSPDAYGTASLSNVFGAGVNDLMSMVGLGRNFKDEFNRSDRSNLARMGYHFGNLDQAGINRRVSNINTFVDAVTGQGVSMTLSSDKQSKINELYSRVQGQGEDRANSLQKALSESDDPEIQALGRQMAGIHGGDKGRFIAGLNRAIGRQGEEQLYKRPDLKGVYNTSKYLTYKDQASAIGEALLGTKGPVSMQPLAAFEDAIATAVGVPAIGTSVNQLRTAVGAFAKTEAGRSIAAQAIDADAETRRLASVQITDELRKLQQKEGLAGKLDTTDQGQKEFLTSVQAAQKLQAIGGSSASDADIKKAAAGLRMSKEEFLSRATGVVGVVSESQRQARAQVEGKEARDNMAAMKAGGLINDKGELRFYLGKKFKGSTAQDFLEAMVKSEGQLSQISELTSGGAREKLLGGSLEARQAMMKDLQGMSVSQMRELANSLKGRASQETTDLLYGVAAGEEQLNRGGKGARLGNLAKMLGSTLSSKDIAKILKEGGTDRLTQALTTELGAAGSKADISAAVQSIKSGDLVGATEKISAVLNSKEMSDARQKKSIAEAAASNPLQAKSNQLLDNMNESLKTQTKLLMSIDHNSRQDTDDAEAKGGLGKRGL